MPTDAEWTELLENCTWTWTTWGGKKGYKVTSKKNGNSIFFPAAGWRDGTSLYKAGLAGFYWSSSLYADGSYYARRVGFDSRGCGRINNSYRWFGLSVRPVIGPD